MMILERKKNLLYNVRAVIMFILASSTCQHVELASMQTNCQGQMNTTQNLKITWSELAKNVAVVDTTLHRCTVNCPLNSCRHGVLIHQ